MSCAHQRGVTSSIASGRVLGDEPPPP